MRQEGESRKLISTSRVEEPKNIEGGTIKSKRVYLMNFPSIVSNLNMFGLD